MSYEQRRDAYLAHIRTCQACVSSFSGDGKSYACAGVEDREFGDSFTAKAYVWRNPETGRMISSVSMFCDVGRQLIESVCQN